MPSTERIRILERHERYLIFDRLASGGMASVHLGVAQGALGFSRMVAVKRLHPQFAHSQRFVTMLKQEARLAARIRHVNVVQVLDILEVDGEVFVVMEYVRGVPFDVLVSSETESNHRLAPEHLVPILAGALRVLHAAHEATDWDGKPLGIVHRDFSPQNILVGIGGVPRVIDFGVAKALGRGDISRDGEFKGKLAYAAPEQLTGGLITRKVDIFAAGIMLWELLAGARLFGGGTESETFGNVLRRTVENPVKVALRGSADVAEDSLDALAAVAMRALERNPTMRFGTAMEMAEALERAHPSATPADLGSWVERLGAERLAHEHAMVREVERMVASGSAGLTTGITNVDGTTHAAAPVSSLPSAWPWLVAIGVATLGAATGGGAIVAALLR